MSSFHLGNKRVVVLLMLLCALIITIFAPIATRSSKGDESYPFQFCLENCQKNKILCEEQASLTLFGIFPKWTCEHECRYLCMWERESERRKKGKSPRQYFGKWPFSRIFGIQEVFSTLFSVLNGIPHVYELTKRKSHLVPKGLPFTLKVLSIANTIVGINTWLWSTAFHARDTWFTERLDYHCATFHMIFHAVFSISRLVYEISPAKVNFVTFMIGLTFCGMFIHHVWYMNFVSFDYGWNMLFTASFVIIQALTWLVWAGLVFSKTSSTRDLEPRKCAWMVVRFQFCLIMFALFEAFDFPPYWDLLDAHAIWHGLTVPLVVYWYSFRELDAKLMVQAKGGGTRGRQMYA
jgi:hypothetical protein